MHGRVCWLGFSVLMLTLGPLGAAASAQDTTRPEETPGEVARSAQTGPPVIAPEGLEEESGIRLLPEGSFLTRARGRMVRLNSGAWAFVFNPDEAGAELAPMVLLPCMQLAAMEQIAEASPESALFLLNGQVFVYRGRNFLLPTLHAVVSGAGREGEELGEGASGGMDGEEVSVDDLIEALDEATPRADRLSPTPDPRATPKGLWQEGELVTLRRGRVLRSEEGAWTFAIDNDVDLVESTDAPMTILPCLNLERIEERAQRRSGSLPVVLSGRVFVYGGRNYVMPTMFVEQRSRGAELSSGR